jgi:hypothetical protein
MDQMSTESPVQNRARLNVANAGGVVWRNNVGVLRDETGRTVRFGLCNDSKRLNQSIKSSDLIGIMPVLIKPHHVGRTMGIFTAMECKAPGWHLTQGDERGQAQAKFIKIVKDLGGFAGFVTSEADMWELLK